MEAKQCYTDAITQQPALAVAWNNLGCVSLDEADGTAAITHFSRAIYFDPKLECAYTNLVKKRRRRGKRKREEREERGGGKA